ncbi:Rap1 GTPase-activating protein 1 [Thecamonas trahens ATCC 50062]|uniref:Rap1 GTPase-activating protein 1 n=1 Tax=Thecamonas trahens ATCC 50062 TaxID=461836 RepID=A0A0L0DBW4_THETB|nr:Rap1 GTPase-activating protein 1 [Thecamonas trahens ATCC 50062]KNC49844.1 Rap1 GTPase-activating protein 1 [Thecamonas trahens ATCC 50062]|eukprot:XP_013757333.1 Rap1 GTPase-activating protein 1 [Thecamonas trahens ATCC 50062]
MGNNDSEYTSSGDEADETDIATELQVTARVAAARATQAAALGALGGVPDHCPESPLGLLKPAGGWTIEPVDERVWRDKASFNVLVEDDDDAVGWYREYFAHKEHTNFVGSDKSYGPMAVSLVWEGAGARTLRAIVWARTGNYRLLFPPLDEGSKAGSAKAQLKAVLTAVKPEYASAAKKMVILNQQRHAAELAKLEDSYLPRKYKFGLVYVREGQTCETEFLANDYDPSPNGLDAAFVAFTNLIGTRVPLKGWDGYRAGLDVDAGGTGDYSLFAQVRGYDVMFHVAPSSRTTAKTRGRRCSGSGRLATTLWRLCLPTDERRTHRMRSTASSSTATRWSSRAPSRGSTWSSLRDRTACGRLARRRRLRCGTPTTPLLTFSSPSSSTRSGWRSARAPLSWTSSSGRRRSRSPGFTRRPRPSRPRARGPRRHRRWSSSRGWAAGWAAVARGRPSACSTTTMRALPRRGSRRSAAPSSPLISGARPRCTRRGARRSTSRTSATTERAPSWRGHRCQA